LILILQGIFPRTGYKSNFLETEGKKMPSVTGKKIVQEWLARLAKYDEKIIKSLDIPEEVNVYLLLKERAKTEPSYTRLVQALEDTMDHFKIPSEQKNQLGDFLQRFSMLLCIQDENIRLQIPTNVKWLNILTDMVEYYNNRAEELLQREGKDN
jgi:hypothetical protein